MIAAWLAVVTLGACAAHPARLHATRTHASMHARGEDYCAPPIPFERAFVEDPAPPDAPRAARLAAILGLRATYEKLRVDPSAVTPAERLAALEHLAMATSLVDALVAEIDCEGERADQVTDYLQTHDRRRQNALTIASILSGAGAAIVTTVLSGSDHTRTEQWVGGVGGGASAVLALSILAVGAKIEFRHERNHLADIWYGPEESALYPPFLWAYLTRPGFSNAERESIRARIVARWRVFHPATLDPETAALLFGSGGTYDATTLGVRATLLDQIKAEVSLASQDLASLEIAMLATRSAAPSLE